MASGRPVIAYDRGGARDTVVPGRTGVLFPEQSVEGLVEAVERFEAARLHEADGAALAAHAARFSEAAFREGITRLLPDELRPAGIAPLSRPAE